MLIAASDMTRKLFHHVNDRPWGESWQVEVFGMKVSLMSSGIASMILVALVLAVVLPLIARKRKPLPTGGHNVLEALVVFIRDMVARPALHDQAYVFLPYLLTVFVFVLGMNLIGMIPIQPVLHGLSAWVPWLGDKPIGGTATSIPTTCAGLAATTLLTIIGCGWWRAARRKHEKDHWPMWKTLPAAPLLWLGGLSPSIPGPIGRVLVIPLAGLELIGAIAKCFALMIRLVANMMAGHFLLAVLMLFAVGGLSDALQKEPLYLGVSILCILGSVAATILDLLVACLQAYIFTFLTAMFLGLYVEPAH